MSFFKGVFISTTTLTVALVIFLLSHHANGRALSSSPVNDDYPSSLNVNVITSGSYANFAAFATTKNALAQAALLVYAKLPSNKTGTNLTYVANQLDFAQEYTSLCNSSAFADACSTLWSMSYLLNINTGSLPIGWTSLVTYLAYKGVDEIYNFSKYGCTGVISVSRFGTSLEASNTTCPTPSTTSKSNSHIDLQTSTDFSTSSCWSAPYLNGFDSSCKTFAYGLPEAGIVTGYGSASTTGEKSSIADIDSFGLDLETSLRESVDSERDSFAQSGGAMQSAILALIQAQMGFTDTSNSQILQAYSSPYAYSDIQLNEQQSFSSNCSSIRSTVVQFLLTQIQPTGSSASYFANQIGYMVDSLHTVKETLSEGTYREPNYNDFEYKQQASGVQGTTAMGIVENCTIAKSAMVSAVQSGNVGLFNRLQFNILNGIVMEDVPYCNLNYSVDTALISGQNIYQSSNISLTQNGVTTEYQTYGSNIGGDIVPYDEEEAQNNLIAEGLFGSAVGGLLLEFAGGFGVVAGLFLAELLVANIVEDGVAEVEYIAKQGFTETLDAIQAISIMSYEEYTYTIDELNDQLGKAEADILCQESWTLFNSYQGYVQTDMVVLNETYTECNGLNLTGTEYVECEYSYTSNIPPDHFDIFNKIINQYPELDWSSSAVGSFVLDCSKYQSVYNGLGPSNLATAMYDMYQAGLQAIYQASMLMEWIYVIDTMHNAAEYNSTFVNNTEKVSASLYAMQNITSDFTCWFRDEVIPPAIAAHFPSSLWTDFGVDPPSKTRYNIEPLNPSDFSSKGPITPLVWSPNIQSDFSSEKGSNSAVNLKQSALEFFTIQNSKNITESAVEYCASVPCPYLSCSCTISNSSSIECENGVCSAEIMVEYTFNSTFPARGWAGPYGDDSTANLLQSGLKSCSMDDMSVGDLCIPGLFIQNLDGDNIQLFVNGTWSLNIVPEDNYERQALMNSSNTEVREAMASGNLMFQMYDSLWGWKYGVEDLAEYFGNYYSAYPNITLQNVFLQHNSSDFQDDWQYYWVVNYGDGENDFFYAYITEAETSFYSNSTYGFSCQQGYENYDESSNDCILTQVEVEYPSKV